MVLAAGRSGRAFILPASSAREAALTRLNLPTRADHRVLRVARSIAHLAGSASMAPAHVAEAVQYRRFTKD